MKKITAIIFLGIMFLFSAFSSKAVAECIINDVECLAPFILPDYNSESKSIKEWSAVEGKIISVGNVISYRIKFDDESLNILRHYDEKGFFGLDVEIVERFEEDGYYSPRLRLDHIRSTFPSSSKPRKDTSFIDFITNPSGDTKVNALFVRNADQLEANVYYWIHFIFKDNIPEEGVTIQPNLQLTVDTNWMLIFDSIGKFISDNSDWIAQSEYFVLETDRYEKFKATPQGSIDVYWTDKKNSYLTSEAPPPDGPNGNEAPHDEENGTSINQPISIGSGNETIPIDSADPGLPDFILRKLELKDNTGQERYNYTHTEEIYMYAQSKNIGDADWAGDEDDIYVRWYLSGGYNARNDPNDWIRVATDQIQEGNLDKGETRTEWAVLNLNEHYQQGHIEPGKIHNLVACVDRKYDTNNGDGEVPEIHKSNNCSTEAVFFIHKIPDPTVTYNFQATWLLMQGDNRKVLPQEHFNLDSSFLSAESDAPHDMGITYKLNGEIVHIHVIPGGELKRGMTYSTVISDIVSPQTVGVHRIDACIDPYNEIPETNEEDNCLPLLFEVVDVNNTEYPIVQLETQGHIPGPRWLSCKNNEVQLVYDNVDLHTHWRYHEPEPGKFAFQCLANDLFLDAVTYEERLTLSPFPGDPYTGALWNLIYQGDITYFLETFGHIPGPKFLDGATGEGAAKLAWNADPPYTGATWKIYNVTNNDGYEYAFHFTSKDTYYDPQTYEINSNTKTSIFEKGDTINFTVRINNITKNFRERIEVFHNGYAIWVDERGWEDVGTGWGHHYTTTNESYAWPGEYTFLYMIDTGVGYYLITQGKAFVPYPPPYIYESTYTANGLIENPTTGKQDLVNPKDTFHLGESMAILSRINEVTASHMWKMEIWHQRPEDTEPQFWWHFESGWNDVGDGWDYSEIYFTQTAEDLGTFHFKVYLELGQGYFLLGEKLTEVVE